MIEMEDAARRKATAMECARKVVGFCESRRRVGVTSVSPIVNLNGEEVVGYNLVLQGGRKANHLRTTVQAFGLAVVSVSRNAWDHGLTPEGRQLLRNIITIGQAPYSIDDPRTIFSLAAERIISSAAEYTPSNR